jgi:hypothetical protein
MLQPHLMGGSIECLNWENTFDHPGLYGGYSWTKVSDMAVSQDQCWVKSVLYISTDIIFLLPTYSVDQVPMSESLAQDYHQSTSYNMNCPPILYLLEN